MNDEIRDITIIGAGPVGMVTAFWAGMREASSQIIDSLPELGGQLTTLYPEKWIFDVPGFPRILAKDLVEELRKQSLEQFDVPVSLETTADRVEYEDSEAASGSCGWSPTRATSSAARSSSPAATARSSPRSCPATT